MEAGLESTTYKLKPGNTDSSVYFTIVGDDKIEAMFVNSKEMQSFQWITALMTAYTRQIKLGEDISSIIEDMKETFDPNGSYMVMKKKDKDGNQLIVNSVIHHLGLILEEHVENG